MINCQHILWDWNGTLLDDVWLCVDIINKMLARRGAPSIDIQRYKAIFDFPVQGYYQRAGFDFSKETFGVVVTEFCDEYERRVCECSLHDGARTLLENFAKVGIPQSIISATEQTRLETNVSASGIMSLFDRVIGQTDHYAAGKAGKAKQWLTSQDIPGDKVLLIGDTTHDAHVAEGIGSYCILVSRGHHPREKLEGTSAWVVEELSQLGILFRGACP